MEEEEAVEIPQVESVDAKETEVQPPVSKPRGRGRNTKQDSVEVQASQTEPAATAPKSGRGRKVAAKDVAEVSPTKRARRGAAPDEETLAPEETEAAPEPAKRGRKGANSAAVPPPVDSAPSVTEEVADTNSVAIAEDVPAKGSLKKGKAASEASVDQTDDVEEASESTTAPFRSKRVVHFENAETPVKAVRGGRRAKAEEVPAPDATAAKNSRKRKLTTETPDEVEVPKKAAPVKRSGRGAKSTDEAHDDITEEVAVSVEAEAAPAKGRGKAPRKGKVTVDIEQSEPVVEPTKPRRGRARK